MATLRKAEVERSLARKGFSRRDGKHIRFTYIYRDGARGPSTHFSHGSGSGEISAALVSTMARQLYLSTSGFVDLVECPLGRDEYENILRAEGQH